VQDAVRTAYELAGLAEPQRFLWYGSPLAGALAAARLAPGERGVSVRAAVRTGPWAAARARLTATLGPAGWSRHWVATSAQTWHLLVDRIVSPLRTRLDAELADDRMVVLDAIHGQHDAAWLGAFSGSIEPVNGTAGQAPPNALEPVNHSAPELAGIAPELAGIAEVARLAGWWWPYERIAILTPRPVQLHRDNVGRLHHGGGPALFYPDGWGLHAWRGMPIPPELTTTLHELTAEQIRVETNAEIRRVMLEHFGFERYLRDSAARELHRDEWGTLWRVELPRDEPLVMVEVTNATPEPDGTRRTYFLRVPPTTRTAHEAVAWTFGLSPQEYAPLEQT
jgi:hypothetical protein